MLAMWLPDNGTVDDGSTSSSVRLYRFVTETFPGVSSTLLSAWMKCACDDICQTAGQQLPLPAQASAAAIPWLGLASSTRSSTFVRVVDHHRTAQRASMPPWLWVMTVTRWRAFAAIASTAKATYSAETWMSVMARFGRATVQTS